MAKLVESPNRSTQQSAASCLVRYAISHPRKDVILPVLRWLSDPDWIEIGSERAPFIHTMDKLDLPESVPGLIWIIEHDEYNRGWAARTLAHYKDPRAVPALKKVLEQEAGIGMLYTEYYIQCLLASGGLSEDEQVVALEAYAARIVTPEGREEIERYRGYGDAPLNTQVAIGQYMARQIEVSDGLASRALARAESLQSKAPVVARELLTVAQGWQSQLVEVDILRRIGAGVADAETIVRALERRKRLRECMGRELRTLADAGGSAPGISAVLLADEALAHSILDTGDQLAQFALLACARLTQMTLPAEKVGSLLGVREADLALAAERYLLAEDSPEARRLLLERHPNAAFITGWRENRPLIGGDNFDAIGRVEEKLRAEVLQANGPREIYALLANYKHGHLILRVYPKHAVYTAYEDVSRYRERVISQTELAGFKDFITNNKLAEMGPQFGPCHHDCSAAEFLVLTRQGGRRVFSHLGIGGWISVIANFHLLGQGDGARVHYYIEEKINVLEVLYAGETPRALDVWRQGADLRVFVERESTPEEIEQERKDDAVEDDEDDEVARAELRRRAVERERARFSWRKLDGDALGEETTQPPGYSTFDEDAFEIERDDFPAHLNDHLAQAIAGDFVVLARSSEEGGLWKKAAGKKPVRLSRAGVYANPLVTPDGKWVVAAKTDSNWGEPNYVVRFNLQTRREYRIDLPPADQFDSAAYVAAHNKVLLRRASDKENKSSGPEEPEFYLLDAATGRTQKVTGEFAPLLQEGRRPLQPTGKPFEYWAAIPDREKNRTRVGRYNSRDFSFQTVLDAPQLTFGSFSMCVDENEAKLLVVYGGQLLRLPLH
jgi:PBS lyase HEAT-like repeat-containing protein